MRDFLYTLGLLAVCAAVIVVGVIAFAILFAGTLVMAVAGVIHAFTVVLIHLSKRIAGKRKTA